jgi:hypothetical protein
VEVWRLVIEFAQSFINAFEISKDSSSVNIVTPCCNDSSLYYVSTLPLNCIGRDFSDSRSVSCIQRSVQVRNKLIILTEADNISQAAVALFASLRATGIEIFFVAVGNTADTGSMKAMASLPLQSHYIKIDDYNKLQGILPALIGVTCNTTMPNTLLQSSYKDKG